MSTINEYLLQRFPNNTEGTQELEDIVNHGMSGGVSGFIYHFENYTLFLDHEDEILEYCESDCGYTLSDLAANCSTISELATKAVWMYVEGWACTEYNRREDEVALAA